MSNYNIEEQKELIAKISTMDLCERYMANVERLNVPELAPAVNRRMVQIRTELNLRKIDSQHPQGKENASVVEQLIICLAAYEQTLKNKYAGRIRPQITERGFIQTIDSLVQTRRRSEGFIRLKKLGLVHSSFVSMQNTS
jgi:hypothetical protein